MMFKNLIATVMYLLVCSYLAVSANANNEPVTLQQPTGNFAVGTVIYEWVDKTRNFSYSSYPQDKRIIPVQFWYPSAPDNKAKKAPYSALSKDYTHVSTNSMLYSAFAKSIGKTPLIIITPGRGVERYGYTTIAEQLASSGYIVAAIDIPQVGYVIYNSGLIVKPSSKFRPPRGMMAGPYEKVDSFFEEPTKIGLRDIEFVMSKIKRLNKRDVTGRFTKRIDLNRIGVFGHSLGGRIAGAFVAGNRRVKAYISMEGIPPRKARYDGLIKVPQAMLVSSGTYPYAKVNYDALVKNRGSLVYMIELKDFGHNSVTDFPKITPDQFKYKIDPTKGLNISRKIVLSFFDQHLLGKGDFQRVLSSQPEINSNMHLKP